MTANADIAVTAGNGRGEGENLQTGILEGRWPMIVAVNKEGSILPPCGRCRGFALAG